VDARRAAPGQTDIVTETIAGLVAARASKAGPGRPRQRGGVHGVAALLWSENDARAARIPTDSEEVTDQPAYLLVGQVGKPVVVADAGVVEPGVSRPVTRRRRLNR
jgi:hypothetical protein